MKRRKIKQRLDARATAKVPLAIAARDKTIQKSLLGRLVRPRSIGLNIALILNQSTPPGTLHGLARRRGLVGSLAPLIVEHPNCSPETLALLAKRRQSHIRKLIARDPRCPSDTVISLARDKDWDVVIAAVKNHNCPSDVLMELALSLTRGTLAMHDFPWRFDRGARENWDARAAIATNPNIPPEALRLLADYLDEIKPIVAINPNCPVDLLEQWEDHALWVVRWGVTCSPKADSEMLLRLTQDRTSKVAEAAVAAILERQDIPDSIKAMMVLSQ